MKDGGSESESEESGSDEKEESEEDEDASEEGEEFWLQVAYAPPPNMFYENVYREQTV